MPDGRRGLEDETGGSVVADILASERWKDQQGSAATVSRGAPIVSSVHLDLPT